MPIRFGKLEHHNDHASDRRQGNNGREQENQQTRLARPLDISINVLLSDQRTTKTGGKKGQGIVQRDHPTGDKDHGDTARREHNHSGRGRRTDLGMHAHEYHEWSQDHATSNANDYI